MTAATPHVAAPAASAAAEPRAKPIPPPKPATLLTAARRPAEATAPPLSAARGDSAINNEKIQSGIGKDAAHARLIGDPSTQPGDFIVYPSGYNGAIESVSYLVRGEEVRTVPITRIVNQNNTTGFYVATSIRGSHGTNRNFTSIRALLSDLRTHGNDQSAEEIGTSLEIAQKNINDKASQLGDNPPSPGSKLSKVYTILKKENVDIHTLFSLNPGFNNYQLASAYTSILKEIGPAHNPLKERELASKMMDIVKGIHDYIHRSVP